jgi:hypothetical protein
MGAQTIVLPVYDGCYSHHFGGAQTETTSPIPLKRERARAARLTPNSKRKQAVIHALGHVVIERPFGVHLPDGPNSICPARGLHLAQIVWGCLETGRGDVLKRLYASAWMLPARRSNLRFYELVP